MDLLPDGAKIFLVGGFLRDTILNRQSFDRDYVIQDACASDLAKAIAERLSGHFVLLDEQRDIARVVMPDKMNYLDFAKCSGQNIFEDINNRDFSINALAYDLKKMTLIDTQNSCRDLAEKKIRTLSEKNILDDPLRILRAYRFKAQLDFEIEPATDKIIWAHSKLLDNVAKERVQTELIKLFEGEQTAKTLIEMTQNGLLFELIEEMKEQVDIPPNLHHHLWLIDHSLETVNRFEQHINCQPSWIIEHLNQPFGQAKRYAYLKLACLLHDLGKPQTWQIDPETQRHRFIKHDEIGAEMAKPILKKFKFSKNQIAYVQKLIKYHIYPSQIIKSSEDATEKAVNRMFRKLEDETVDIILLAQADRMSARGEEITDEIVNSNLKGLGELLEKYREFKESKKPLPKLLSGNEIMELFAIKPGPELGEIINKLKESQLDGEITTRDDAINFIKTLK